jgi:hypothetical protein
MAGQLGNAVVDKLLKEMTMAYYKYHPGETEHN